MKKKFVKHPNISKCYDNDCVQTFILLFMLLLTAVLLKTVIFTASDTALFCVYRSSALI